MNVPRRLPIRVLPAEGEALDSWIEASAHRFDAQLADFLGVLAAEDYGGRGDARHGEPRSWTVQLPDQAAARITALTGLAPRRLHAMTLVRYDGVALRIDPHRPVVDRHHLWGRGSGSRYCPACLAESGGRWQLWWRLGWAFACPRHHQLLADTCPACHRPQRQRASPIHVIPRPGRCARPRAGQTGLAEQRCDADLTRAVVLHLPEDHPALRAQRLLLDIIDSGRARRGIYAADPQPARLVLADARALANRILGYATIPELAAVVPADLLTLYARPPTPFSTLDTRAEVRPGFMAPAHAIRTAVGLTAAFAVLAAADIQSAGTALRWLVEGLRRDQLAVTATSTTTWGRGTTPTLAAVQLAALGPLLPASDRLRYRTATAYPRRPRADPAVVDRRARGVPTVFWPDWSLRLWPHGAGSSSFGRLVLANALMVVGTNLTLGQTVLKLGTPLSGHGVARLLKILGADASWSQVAAALVRLGDHLDTHDVPIDYQRRGQLDYDTLLPDDLWIRSCRRLGRPARERSASLARTVLFERLSGLPADQAPGYVDTVDFRGRLGSFPRFLNSELAVVLDQAAQDYLHQQGIDDEPVAWYPPLDLLDGLQLPGPDPALIDPAALHRVLEHRETSLEAAAARYETTIDVVRHLLIRHPVAHRPTARQARARLRPLLSRAEFQQLYDEQQLSLQDIADRFDTSRSTMDRLAREYDITPRASGRIARITVDADWFYEQYVVHHRTLPELAHEAGVSVQTMSNRAHALGIPLRPRGAGSRRENLDKNGPPPQCPPRAWLYDRYVTRGRTLAELADDAGVSPAVMSRWVHLHDIPTRRAGGASHRANLPQRQHNATSGTRPPHRP